MTERNEMGKVIDFPVDLRTPKMNSERWSLSNVLPKMGLGLIGAGVLFGIGLGIYYHQPEVIVGLSIWVGGVTLSYLLLHQEVDKDTS